MPGGVARNERSLTPSRSSVPSGEWHVNRDLLKLVITRLLGAGRRCIGCPNGRVEVSDFIVRPQATEGRTLKEDPHVQDHGHPTSFFKAPEGDVCESYAGI